MADLMTLRKLESDLISAKGPKYNLDNRLADGIDPYLRIRESTPDYTKSIDAAVALCNRVLPDWHYGIDYAEGFASAYVFQPETEGEDAFEWMGYSTPAVALCLAIVRALIAVEERKE